MIVPRLHDAPIDAPISVTVTDALFDSSIPNLPLIGRGKVRDIYAVSDDYLLIVTSDRLSAFDVVLPDPVPGKGEILTRISLFWFRMMTDLIDNQLTELTVDDVIDDPALAEDLRHRALVVKRLKRSFAVTWPAPAGVTTSRTAAFAASHCPQAWNRRAGSPRRCLHRRAKPRSASTTKTSILPMSRI